MTKEAFSRSRIVPTTTCSGGIGTSGTRALPEETPVAIVYNGTTQAVMMATPGDLEDFGVGFAFCDHAITALDQIRDLAVVSHATGTEVQLWFDETRSDAIEARRRHMAGPVGCGLCGIDSLAEALHPIEPVEASHPPFRASDLRRAIETLRDHQPLHDETHAVHAAGLCSAQGKVVLAREDIGRHNALDKLVGAMARGSVDGTSSVLALTARISVDLVQKCAVARVPVILSVSAPTAHAVRLAAAAGLTVASVGRQGRIDIFSHPERIEPGAVSHVA